jgi:hypothetical protein
MNPTQLQRIWPLEFQISVTGVCGHMTDRSWDADFTGLIKLPLQRNLWVIDRLEWRDSA